MCSHCSGRHLSARSAWPSRAREPQRCWPCGSCSPSAALESVFTDLFDPDGAEIYVRPSSYYLRPTPGQTFATVVESARRRGEVAIGYRIADPGDGHGVVLNPDKEKPMPAIDRLIVLANG